MANNDNVTARGVQPDALIAKADVITEKNIKAWSTSTVTKSCSAVLVHCSCRTWKHLFNEGPH
jgi:hypothetical protein